MTWIVAASTIYGYGALYSDVQVTFSNGTTRDLVQKAYPISNYIAGGFAGSIKIGFKLLQSLSDYLAIPEDITESFAWNPVAVANKWAPIAKAEFESTESEEKQLGSRILLVGASPTEECGLGAKIYFIRFSSPDFEPKVMSQAIKTCSIGSGAGVIQYKHSIKPLLRLSSGIMQAEVANVDGWGLTLGYSIANTLSWYPESGISKHIHTIIVRRGRIRIENSDKTEYHNNGTIVEIRMPKIARSYEEFVSLTQSTGQIAAGAIC